MRNLIQTTVLLVLLLASSDVRAQIQQPPPSGAGGVTPAGVVCDGVTPTGAALQHALDTVPVGSRLTLPPGVCLLNAPLVITRTLTVEGTAANQTMLRQTVPSARVLTIKANDVRVTSLTLEHTGTPVAGGDGLVVDEPGGLSNVYLENIASNRNWRGFVLGCVGYAWGTQLQASLNNNNGFEFVYTSTSCAASQWNISHSLSQLNRGVGFGGFNTAIAVSVGPFLYDNLTFGNEFGGFVFIGSPGHTMHDLMLYNLMSSADNRSGIYLDTYGGSHVVSNPWIELSGRLDGAPQGQPSTPSVASNSGNCLSVTSNNLPGLVIHGGYYWNCSHAGVGLDAPYSGLVGGVTNGNGLAMDAALGRRAGVHIGGDGVTVTGHTFLYTNAPATLHYLHLSGVLSRVNIGHNTYAPGIAGAAIVDSSDATLVGTTPPAFVAGMTVFTNRGDAPGLALYDATNGPTPVKFLQVASGALNVLNAAATTVIQSLSDVGTPSWPTRRGQVTIADAATTATVTLSPVEPDAGYFVQLTPVTLSGGPATGALTLGGVAKAAGSFVVTVTAAPGAGKSVVYDWFVHR